MTGPTRIKDRFDAVQAALLCSVCGGQRHYAPEIEGLRCDSCGTESAIPDAGQPDPRLEQAYDPSDWEAEPPEVDHAHRCETCGGEVVFVGRAVSERCPYCDGAVVLFGGHAHFVPSGLIPFGNSKDQAMARMAEWLRGRWAAPPNLAAQAHNGHLAALYAPFWTFDASKAIKYIGAQRSGRGQNARSNMVSGRLFMTFDDVIIAASDHVTPALRDGIMHGFDPGELRPYRPEYLAGFAAELHGTRVSEGLSALRRDLKIKIEKRIRDKIGGDVNQVTYKAQMSDIRFRRVLLPLWILHYHYGGKYRRIVVSGIDGRCFGERPYSFAKLLAYSAVTVMGAFLVGAMIGAGLAPG
ncbi:MAG: hypothetical protein RQ750_04695 [Roseovarius sp.]|nr:hypothetical protein [Roseovarius sp.]